MGSDRVSTNECSNFLRLANDFLKKHTYLTIETTAEARCRSITLKQDSFSRLLLYGPFFWHILTMPLGSYITLRAELYESLRRRAWPDQAPEGLRSFAALAGKF